MPTLRKTFTNSSRQRDKVCNSCVKPTLYRAINVRLCPYLRWPQVCPPPVGARLARFDIACLLEKTCARTSGVATERRGEVWWRRVDAREAHVWPGLGWALQQPSNWHVDF